MSPALGPWLGCTWLLLGLRLASTPATLGALLLLSVPLLALAAIDADVHRLPDALTLPLYPLSLVVLTGASLLDDRLTAMGWSLAGCALGVSVFLAFALLTPRAALGLGDVKLAGVLGLIAGLGGPNALLLAVWLASALGGAQAVHALRHGAPAHTPIAFGPALILGTYAAIVVVGSANLPY